MTAQLLSVEGLSVSARRGDASVALVSEVSFAVGAGEIVCLVGESGSGKTVTGQATIGLAQELGLDVRGGLSFDGESLTAASPERFSELRRHDVAAVFQDPASALDPVFSIGSQLVEVIRRDQSVGRTEARRHAAGLLEMVGLDQPGRRLRQYPHELSGGMCQRVGIALALAGDPRLLIADEPTSALDVTIRGQILELLDTARRERGLSILLITHDMHVASLADRIVVLYAGTVVESGDAATVVATPSHPYTAGLVASVPSLEGDLASGSRLPAMPGSVPEPGRRPSGCVFAPRCGLVREQCRETRPVLREVRLGRVLSACWRADELVVAEGVRVERVAAEISPGVAPGVVTDSAPGPADARATSSRAGQAACR